MIEDPKGYKNGLNFTQDDELASFHISSYSTFNITISHSQFNPLNTTVLEMKNDAEKPGPSKSLALTQ